MSEKLVSKVNKVAYHRNGICGNGFYVILFKSDYHEMVGILFEEKGSCAVLDVNEVVNGNVDFANGNSWRGDHFEPELRKAIVDYEKEQELKWQLQS
jgi:hypothetical protein